MTVAARAAGLTTSPIRSIALGAPAGTISLALGEPGWPVPDAAVLALSSWAGEATTCSYGPNEGLPELVDALTDRYAVRPGDVMVSAGSQAALFALFQAHVPTGSRVLVPDPGFPAYATLAGLAGAQSTAYPLAADGSLDPDALVSLLDRHDDVSLAVLNHPGNPTGGTATVTDLELVAGACERRGVTLISDEVYRELTLAGPQPSMREVSDRAIV
ncbi:MAG: pyridoxal phosphate-dependent aminotransferase, partial [Actinobacteria bacterium]|nr:pyridoxal phosphate-dependent aminotransferase [Actinomycetota bacterium]